MRNKNAVAIIGMGCIFPKANGLKEYWRLLLNGQDAITEVPETSHWSLDDYFDKDPASKDHTYCSRGGFLPRVSFDPARFGLPPNNLEATDTSQLLALVVAEMALEDAGYGNADSFDRLRTNVILGVTGTQELVIPLGARLGHPVWKRALKNSGIPDKKAAEVIERISGEYAQWQENSFPGLLGNVVAGRVANRLDLGGTNSVVDAACASSLSAINTAMMELVSGKCDMSITGGVDTLNDIFMNMCFAKTGVLSPSGDAKPFSKYADGTVLGEGIGMLVLKRLSDAKRDKNRIYAVIKGMGTSSDGRTGGIYAPNAKGQLRALNAAYEIAGVDPAMVGLIEAHGTGTRVGDKIEFTALKTLAKESNKTTSCAVGSVKSMIGHSKAAAGAAGIIKSALCLYHKVLPPTLKAEEPDPELGINDTPFYLNAVAKPWISQNNTPRISGVSAFGFGGSNFHAVLEEYEPNKSRVSWDGTFQIAAFSAPAREEIIPKILEFNQKLAVSNQWDENERSRETAWLAFQTREAFSNKENARLLILLGKDDDAAFVAQKAISLLQTEQEPWWSKENIYFGSGQQTGKLAFLFPGQGSQYTGMGKDLVSVFPEGISALVDAGNHFANEWKGRQQSLNDYVFPPPAHRQDTETSQEMLRKTDVAQPALCAVSLAMTDILERFHIRPDMACGHSFGELPALFCAGWMDRNTLLTLSCARGRYMAESPGQGGEQGSMMAVKATLPDIEAFIREEKLDLVLANRNSHDQGVLSGRSDEIKKALNRCREKKIRAVELPVAAAFHSSLVENAAIPFKKRIKDFSLNPSKIPVFSNTTGVPYPKDGKKAANTLGNQLLNPVNFVNNIEAMFADKATTFVEVGPKSVLTGLTRSILKGKEFTAIAMDSSNGKRSGMEDLARVVCELAAKGFPVDLNAWEEDTEKPTKKIMRIPLTGANIRPKQGCELPPSDPIVISAPPVCQETKQNTPTMASHKITDTAHERAGKVKSTRVDEKTGAVSVPGKKNGGAAMVPPEFHFQQPQGQNPVSQIRPGAMDLIYRGLESMEALQSQTARAHEKFLETQALASQTLQKMMEQTRLFAATGVDTTASHPASPGVPHAPGKQIPDFDHAASLYRPVPLPGAETSEVKSSLDSISGLAISSHPNSQTETLPEAATAKESIRSTQTIMTTVSRLTGFPEEMLTLDMEIESDLGIDSIKRVEIVSELEKLLPDTVQFTPENMGSLKTLRDILNAIDQTNQTNQVDAPQTPTNQTDPCPGNNKAKTLILATVSRLTGFPEEMLTLDMEIESDLGIDSIKRVEIVSELEKLLPDTVQFTPENMGTLKTLGDILSAMEAEKTKETTPESVEAAPGTGVESPSVMATIVKVIGELTGFPSEMLEPEMDLESDLGIDSIKRVEILSRLEQDLPDADSFSSEKMAQLKTLADIASHIKVKPSVSPKITPLESEPPLATNTADGNQNHPTPSKLLRQTIKIKQLPMEQVRFHNGSRITISASKTVYITKDETGFSEALAQGFKRGGIRAETISMAQVLNHDLDDMAGLVIVYDTGQKTDNFLKSAFLLAKKSGAALMDAATEQGAFFSTVSFLGGNFGFDDQPISDPLQGGLAGLAKTAGLEWPTILCRSLDMSPFPEPKEGWANEAKPDEAHMEALASLTMIHGPVEMGIKDNLCNIPELMTTDAVPGTAKINQEDIFVISGGARGVTAECALALAIRYQPTIVLLGRSPKPWEEPQWLRGVTNEADIKRAVMEQEFKGRHPSPVELETRYREIISNREILSTLERICRTGARVSYLSVDVLDSPQVNTCLKTVQKEFGTITGLIHGAGVVQDRFILDKSEKQFSRVMDTKVQGLANLLGAIDREALKHLVLFSSVAARTGNPGQVDYAMANEVLNKTAKVHAQNFHNCKVLSINWGPWEGGMVTPLLKNKFEKLGIHLIPLKQGAAKLIEEMESNGPVEVVIGGQLPRPGRPEPKRKTNLTTAYATEVGTELFPILNDHLIAGQPVVPFALMVEWAAHAAKHANPGLVFAGIDDMRVLKGIKPGTQTTRISINTGKCIPENNLFRVETELYSENGIHAKGLTLLAEALPESPVQSPLGHMSLHPSSLSVEEAYESILFHQGQLKGIKSIVGTCKNGITIVAKRAEKPATWIKKPHASNWTMDPLLLDSAFQAAIIWSYEQTGKACLPAYIANLKIYDSFALSTEDVSINLTVNEQSKHAIKGYFTFVDDKNRVIASIMGFEAVMDPSLIKRFKPKEKKAQKQVRFTRKEILAFAEGKPSMAFGRQYEIFDKEREIARLPRPPYFFMDRVVSTDAIQWEMTPGGWIEAEFDLPVDAWYFKAVRSKVLPFSILLEIALQPCGWLAAYAGSALKSDKRLYFRNLGGEATLVKPITRDMGTLTMRARMTNVSEAGGLIIQDFNMEVLRDGEPLYRGKTNFGFFTRKALANQTGIRATPLDRTPPESEIENAISVDFTDDAPLTPGDDKLSQPTTGMPSKALRMIDKIDVLTMDGGLYGNGYVKASKIVDPDEWFFKAHFYQDPVCPGSLGIESFLQLVTAYAMEKWAFSPAEHEMIMAGNDHKWTYRGQITPANKLIEIQAHIKSITKGNKPRITADGILKVDGLIIYQMENFTLGLHEKSCNKESLELQRITQKSLSHQIK